MIVATMPAPMAEANLQRGSACVMPVSRIALSIENSTGDDQSHAPTMPDRRMPPFVWHPRPVAIQCRILHGQVETSAGANARDGRGVLEVALELGDDDRGLAADDWRLVELRDAVLVVAVETLGKVDLVHAEVPWLELEERLEDED